MGTRCTSSEALLTLLSDLLVLLFTLYDYWLECSIAPRMYTSLYMFFLVRATIGR
jgi:hypothetical protein